MDVLSTILGKGSIHGSQQQRERDLLVVTADEIEALPTRTHIFAD
jgi:hypothetical protein